MPCDGWAADGLPNAPDELPADVSNAEVTQGSGITADAREDLLTDISIEVDRYGVTDDEFPAFAEWLADQLMFTDQQRDLLAGITLADVVAHQVEMQRRRIAHARQHTAWHPRGRQAIGESQRELRRLLARTRPTRTRGAVPVVPRPRASSGVRRPVRRETHSRPRKARAPGGDDSPGDHHRAWRLAARDFGRGLEASVRSFLLRILGVGR